MRKQWWWFAVLMNFIKWLERSLFALLVINIRICLLSSAADSVPTKADGISQGERSMDHSQIEHLQGLIYTYCGRTDQHPIAFRHDGLRKCTPGWFHSVLSIFTMYTLYQKVVRYYIRLVLQEDCISSTRYVAFFFPTT